MAKQRSNNSENKSLYKTGGIYTKQQHKDMDARYGDDARAKAAAMKEDIHKENPVPRYPAGSESYKKAQAVSEENARKKAEENRALNKQYGPGSGTEQRQKADDVPQPPKLKNATDKSTGGQQRIKEQNRDAEIETPIFKYKKKQ
jgi:hypothetical protein